MPGTKGRSGGARTPGPAARKPGRKPGRRGRVVLWLAAPQTEAERKGLEYAQSLGPIDRLQVFVRDQQDQELRRMIPPDIAELDGIEI